MKMAARAQADDTLSIQETMTVATLGLRRAMIIYSAEADDCNYLNEDILKTLHQYVNWVENCLCYIIL